MQIKIGKVPGRTQVLQLQEGATIADAVRDANLDVTGHELRHNGTATENFNATIADGAIILLTPRIKGNSDSQYISVNFEEVEYAVASGTTVGALMRIAGFDEDDIEGGEVIAMEKVSGSDRIFEAVDYNKIVEAFGKYNIMDVDDVVIPVEPVQENIECGCSCMNNVNTDLLSHGESIKVTIGNVEIVITKK